MSATAVAVTGPVCRLVELTPGLAEEILTGNTRNRSLRRVHVQKLAGAMERGEWVVNGEPIQVAVDGTLLNGQHRLHAVRESGITITALLVTGLPTSAQRTMDTGARRNLSDILALRNETDTMNLAAVLGLLYRYREGHRMDGSGRTAPTPQEALDLLAREPTIRDSMRIARRVNRATKMRGSIVAVLAHLFDESHPGKGQEFFEALCESREQPRDSPVRQLHAILDRKRRERNYALPTYVLCAMTIKTFNAWCERRTIGVLTFRPGGDKPEPFPAIAQSR